MIQNRENCFLSSWSVGQDLQQSKIRGHWQRLCFWEGCFFFIVFSDAQLEHLTDQAYTGKKKALQPRRYCS